MNDTELRDLFLAGKASLKDNQIEKLEKDFAVYVGEIVSGDLYHNDPESFKKAVEILTFAVPSKLAPYLMNSISKDLFYELGNYLLNLESGKDEALFKQFIHIYLNLFRIPDFLVKIREERRWDSLIDGLIRSSRYTVKSLIDQRTKDYPKKTLFRVVKGKKETTYSWENVLKQIRKNEISLKNILGSVSQEGGKIAFLLENSIDMALLDLSCLYSGIVNIMIPANSVSKHIWMILEETRAPIMFVDNEKQLAKVKTIKNDLKYLEKVVLLQGTSAEEWVISYKQFYEEPVEKNGKNKAAPWVRETDDIATIMYTSGTTGEPKGIVFSYHNIVYKRFCRAMALPEIGENDRLLAYLPLFHTFGRYLELMGSVFWAAEYIFMENPSVETMIGSMQNFNPTVFISIPKKWLQVYEYISHRVDIEFDDNKIIQDKVNQVTGGSLRYGLSAAGFLPPEVFEFFQKYGIELMSGFGMTEATGGITMTPPGKYKYNSLGCALPGIEISVADDGELLIRGPYVMLGYFNQPREEIFTSDGWFPTGDVMVQDDDGYIEIIDRKKEIYKNIKGETIAPQKIENYFLDFEYVKQVFLVGDHRPYNTVLIYPDEQANEGKLLEMDVFQQREYFASVVVTVNNFLAPFERIINFRIIERHFTAEKGELTPKGTFKRRAIENNFSHIIEEMYRKEYIELAVDDFEVRVPNWFLREIGCLSRDMIVESSYVSVPKRDLKLCVKVVDKEKKIFRVGSFNYTVMADYIDLQVFLTNPVYWIGNSGILEFTGDLIFQWYRQKKKESRITFHSTGDGKPEAANVINELNNLIKTNEKSLAGLHLAVLVLQIGDDYSAKTAARYIELILTDSTLPAQKIALNIVQLPNISNHLIVRKELFKVALKAVNEIGLAKLLKIYLKYDYNILDEIIIELIVNLKHHHETLEAIEYVIETEIRRLKDHIVTEDSVLFYLFILIEWFGVFHPAYYEAIRLFLVRIQLDSDYKHISETAHSTRDNVRAGFRKWLGVNQTISVDMETGEEYSWDDVIIFEEGIDVKDSERIVEAIKKTAVLREAIFLFSRGTLIRLNNILPGGVYISYFSSTEFKTVYRVSIQTRLQGSFDIILNLNQKYEKQRVLDKINWLILAGSRHYVQELIEDFGGYWGEFDIWSQKFIPGVTIDKFFRSEYRKNDEVSNKRMYNLWPFFIWNAAAAYMNFWKLTGKKLKISDPGADNIIVPLHDYQTGTRFVSFSEMSQINSLTDLFMNFSEKLIKPCEQKYPHIRRATIWNYVFSGVINAFGEKRGIEILRRLNEELEKRNNDSSFAEIKLKNKAFIEFVEKNGFVPKQSYFAIKRFHRWFDLNQSASMNAQAQMLSELYETYNLLELEKLYPETRTKFFLETVFADSDSKITQKLKSIINKQRNNELEIEEFLSAISAIQSEFELTEKESFFLIRISYPHIKPTDSAVLIKPKTEGFQTANLVVNVEDYEGTEFRIRKPISPREISRLHQLFIEANLIIQFKPEHMFLVVISERGYIIGGLYYSVTDSKTVHMEKVVVSNKYRKKGVSEKLMNEFFSRMIDERYEYVTTGFFRPEYFYRFGFKIEKKYSGLVKKLKE